MVDTVYVTKLLAY